MIGHKFPVPSASNQVVMKFINVKCIIPLTTNHFWFDFLQKILSNRILRMFFVGKMAIAVENCGGQALSKHPPHHIDIV
jgi:hypothetical protein